MTCAPTRYTPPLTDVFEASVDWWLPIIEKAWAKATPGFRFDDWQVELLRRVTELLPSGELRWRSCLISMGRQNGKSEIVGALGIWALLRNDSRRS